MITRNSSKNYYCYVMLLVFSRYVLICYVIMFCNYVMFCYYVLILMFCYYDLLSCYLLLLRFDIMFCYYIFINMLRHYIFLLCYWVLLLCFVVMLCYYLLLLRYDIMLGYFILFNVTSWHTWLTAVYATFWILAKSPMLKALLDGTILIALATAINCSNFWVRYYTQAISIALVVAEEGFCIGSVKPESWEWDLDLVSGMAKNIPNTKLLFWKYSKY